MKHIKRFINIIFVTLLANFVLLAKTLSIFSVVNIIGFYTLTLMLFVLLNVFPRYKTSKPIRQGIMLDGYELVLLSAFTFTINPILNIYVGICFVPEKISWVTFIINCILCIISGAILIINGLIRIYTTSVQLGIKWRLMFAFLCWFPIVNIVLLWKLCRIVRDEYDFETQKLENNYVRKENELCKTKYPLLLIHGVFFRDRVYFNYWGRIPGELIRNGAVIYYGNHQSAATVENSAIELKSRITQIIEETGCEKLNIIAHSKGGLDARTAISCYGMDQYVASLTTINTPHRGCGYADYLLQKAPKCILNFITKSYNSALKKLGDKNPDFFGAVNSLTEKSCSAINKKAIDKDNVYYQRFTSIMNRWSSAKFPLNITYLLIRHFNKQNDGLVSVESAKWGSRFNIITTDSKRGISHADVIDLYRENINQFDVREFYVDIVKDLKERNL